MAEPKKQFKIFRNRRLGVYAWGHLIDDDYSPDRWDFVGYFDGTVIEAVEECRRRERLMADNPAEGVYLSRPEGPDPVDRPAHYTGPVPGVECIEVTRHFDFLRGNAIKYIWRAAHKGRYIEDLRKAAWYIQAAIDQGPPQD